MKKLIFTFALTAAAAAALSVAAQAPSGPMASGGGGHMIGPPGGAPAGPADPVAVLRPDFAAKAKLTVSSSDFDKDGMIAVANTGYGASLSPQVSWTKGPKGVRSYLVVMEDGDFNFKGAPATHWLAYNIPATVTSLPGGLPPQGKAEQPAGMLVGRNSLKSGYLGPHSPPGGTHHYHLQVLALDTALPLAADAARADVFAAAAKHVLASGEIVGWSTGPAGAPMGPHPGGPGGPPPAH